MTRKTSEGGRYKALINKARESDSQQAVNPDPQDSVSTEEQISVDTADQSTVNTVKQESVDTENSKVEKLAENHAVNIERHKSVNTDLQQVSATEKAREVSLTIKVIEPWRRHWSAEAKRQGTNVTTVVVEALKQRFGTPE